MRFFSTAEAMAGHGLSYVKILCSIENVRAVRRKMHFFCESKNLVEYYRTQTGISYPILFNPGGGAVALTGFASRDSFYKYVIHAGADARSTNKKRKRPEKTEERDHGPDGHFAAHDHQCAGPNDD